MILAAIASIGAVLFTMYDPGNDKCKLSILLMYGVGLENDMWKTSGYNCKPWPGKLPHINQSGV